MIFNKKVFLASITACAAMPGHADLMITAVYDGPLSGGVPKGVELYVTEDIADLSAYGIGSANNGNGSAGEEFTFPAVSVSAGEYIYVASESTGFTSYFGFAPDYTGGAMSINGDDAIEVFFNGEVIDLFGDINVDGSGEAWEYQDGWAARLTGSQPSPVFNIQEWTFSSPNALDGASTNDTASNPVPIQVATNGNTVDLMISAVFDGPIPGGLPKGVELYVINDIADLSAYGLGAANNGGGTDGQEFTFPAVSASAGDYIYIGSETTQFASFFGFAPDYVSFAVNINGDDAIELFYNDVRIDLYGDIDVDGTGQPWDYQDGWAARVSGAEPSSEFDLNDWVLSGTNALDGETTNATAAVPVLLEGQSLPPIEPDAVELISTIQGTPSTYGSNRFGDTDVSPLYGQEVTVEAVVVGDFQNADADTSRNLGGFYLQEESADEDGNPLSSEGVFVYANGFDVDVNVGDVVRVSGSVGQYFGETQINNISSIEVLDSDALGSVTPASIDLLSSSDATMAQGGFYQANLESYEGMLVNIVNELEIVEQYQLDRFNEIRLAAGGRLVQFTQTNAPSIDGYQAHLENIGARTITYDDGLNEQNEPVDNLDGFAPYDENTAPRMGDITNNLTGVLDYKWAGNSSSSATWRVRSHIDGTNSFTSTITGDSPNPRPDAAPTVSGTLKISSFNVLNLFTTLDDGSTNTAVGLSPRGADDLTRFGVEPASLEFDRQLAKLVNAITELDADILGLVELENQFDDLNDGSTAIEVLVNALNSELGSTTYDYVYPGQEFVGTDAIAVGFIYKPAVAQITEGSSPAILDDTAAAQLDVFASHDFAADPIFDGVSTNRTSLAVTFTHITSEQNVTLVASHFKSKGSSDLTDTTSPNFDQQDGAGFWNQRRLNGAIALSAWVETNPTNIEEDNVVLLGDFNAYAQEDPIQYLLGQGYTNVENDDAYSFVFSGQTGTLDYALISDSLNDLFTEAAVWHINADEADAIDYNVDYGRDQTMFDETTATRNSDHDPVIFGLNLQAPQTTLTLADAYAAFSEGLANGDIRGTGRSKFIQRYRAYRVNKLFQTAFLYEKSGRTGMVCHMFNRILKVTDGNHSEKDWLTGDGLEAFNQLVYKAARDSNCNC